MGERFNSGMGGYTCDKCKVLIWAGSKGMKDRSKRHFVYSTKATDIVEDDDNMFCSPECAVDHDIEAEGLDKNGSE